MKSYALLLLLPLMIISCTKDELDPLYAYTALKKSKLPICHYSPEADNWVLLYVSEKAWGDHKLHGDVRLDDQDKDGYVPDNECQFGNMGDNDDTNACINPDNPSIITSIRLGGEVGDQYIGPTCDTDGTYRTCFYVSGENLPTSNPNYQVSIGDIVYPIAFQQYLSSSEIVLCVTGLPPKLENIDVYIKLDECVELTVSDLYNAPRCFEITGLRVAGNPGDQYIGPTCDNNGTYRTCFYITGNLLPSNAASYTIYINEQAYSLAFLQVLDSNNVVACIIGVPGDALQADLRLEISGSTVFEQNGLYTSPNCNVQITDLRLAGQPGDQYIGPTCDNNGTYRTCFYITGSFLPTNAGAYTFYLNDQPYTLAFLTVLNSSTFVACVLGIPGDTLEVDVRVEIGGETVFEQAALYISPNCLGEITDFRLAGQAGDAYIGPTCNDDGTYRTCFYVAGSFLPSNIGDYKIFIDNVEYSVAFFQVFSAQERVVCVTGLPASQIGVDVKIQAGALESEKLDLYDAPTCPSGSGQRIRANDISWTQ